jgi:hypothetical protein
MSAIVSMILDARKRDRTSLGYRQTRYSSSRQSALEMIARPGLASAFDFHGTGRPNRGMRFGPRAGRPSFGKSHLQDHQELRGGPRLVAN